MSHNDRGNHYDSPCPTCGAYPISIHGFLACVDQDRRWTCACCKQAICLTCREESALEDSDLPSDPDPSLCDACWCAKNIDPNEPDDLVLSGMTLGDRLLMQERLRAWRDEGDERN